MELLGKSKEELRALCAALGEPAYRGRQIYHALYAERRFDVVQMTNLPAAFRERLAKETTVTLPQIRQRFASADGSVRYLFGLKEAEKKEGKRSNTEGTEGGGTEGAEKTKEGKEKSTDGPLAVLPRAGVRAVATGVERPNVAVEAVFMPSEGRDTICVSTQAGCAVNCQFCLTAQLGLIRNLTPGEILAEVLLPLEENRRSRLTTREKARENADARELRDETAERTREREDAGRKPGATYKSGRGGSDGRKTGKEGVAAGRGVAAGDPVQTNVVLMGQGEPLLNFEAVMAALRILLDPEGMGLSPKHVTLSTSGIVPGIERLGLEKVRPRLAISLNASNDEERDVLMPINKKYPLRVLLAACKKYPLRPWEHLTFEYVMLGGVNDADEDARRVVRLLAPLKSVKVNLIPWNPGELPYHESPPERVEAFRRILTERGVAAFVRYSRGRDVMAACGQLALLQIGQNPGSTSAAI